MKIKLRLGSLRKQEITKELIETGIEITEDADLILTEEGYEEGILYCKDDTDTIRIDFSDILFIESYGKTVYIRTMDKSYTTTTRIYVLEKNLPAEKFVRISNSVIISRNSIQRIRPGLSQKFYLILKNGVTVDVTRTYYYKFKEYYGI